ncbi:MAG TPA: hypothetical protein VFW25_12525 [Silvibacterium sp.]|nr:hypothetical protein [Silvibacterium sp.]
MSARKRFNHALVCRLLAFGFSLAMVSRPPVAAQERQERGQISSEDAVQDVNIAAIDRHLQATDARAEAEYSRVQLLDSQIAEMQGEQRVAFAVLGVLMGGSIVVQVGIRRKAA